MALSVEDAEARLKAMLAWDQPPALTQTEIDQLLEMSKLRDPYDLPPDDANWTPTWDLNIGAAEGWRWKAAKVAGNYGFSTDGQSFNREQVHDHCLRMSESFKRRITGTIHVLGREGYSEYWPDS